MSEPSNMPAAPITWHPNAGDWWRGYSRSPAFWIGAVVIGYVALLGVSDALTGEPIIGLMLLAIGPIPFMLLIGYRWRQFARSAVYDIILTPDKAGLRVDAGAVHITHEWPRLAARENRAEVVLYGQGSRPVVRIPRRAFASQGAIDAFVQLVRQKGDVSSPSGDIPAH